MTEGTMIRSLTFTGPEVRAMLSGAKTQHRVVLKPQPETLGDGHIITDERGLYLTGDHKYKWHPLPLAPGDAIVAKETWQEFFEDELSGGRDMSVRGRMGIPARPDRKSVVAFRADGEVDDHPEYGRAVWRSPVTTPRWASRLTLTVDAVKIERVQDISEADARAEGIEPLFSADDIKRNPELARHADAWTNYLWHERRDARRSWIDAWCHQFSSYSEARGSFSSLWASRHGPDAWDRNDWVCAATFTAHYMNVSEYLRQKGVV